MRIWFWLPLVLVIVGPLTWFGVQKLREMRAQKKGVAVYATMISMEPVKVFGRFSAAMKIRLWVQAPGEARREVSLTSRVPEGQKIEAGMMLPVVIDPMDPKKIYPANADSMKRIQLTGSREQRRQMRKKGL
ncbi:hypothetical protein GOB94_11255 [Granulicella sp. 5B5]|jgi:hypothetical protein|uniref:hypothetical protein n=1 Tax=Granulicella sp. 5B5 TaxID=1617967 RepID=UPI0015F6E1C8|nr:hypothetical protein [Granulicella sp. 5B5]QMV19186.1 hypothetical protein GOB94_11255 [Granulicella sp. 5B5]